MTRKELFVALFDAASGVYDVREARSIANFLAEELFGLGRADIAVEPNRDVEVVGLTSVLEELATGRPAQYIAGVTWFCGLKFAVSEGVLIPRPETEELVAWITTETTSGAKILDIGTGSGAIASALAAEVEGSDVHAVDISEKAIAIAASNAITNGVSVRFAHYDILGSKEWPWQGMRFDVVVSNPPYIPTADRGAMHRNVTGFEPDEALFVPDDDPLIFYKSIAHRSLLLLKPGGRLYFEIYEHAAKGVCNLLEEAGYTLIEVRRDLNGRERMIKAIIQSCG